jgi:hypothetical protein
LLTLSNFPRSSALWEHFSKRKENRGKSASVDRHGHPPRRAGSAVATAFAFL